MTLITVVSQNKVGFKWFNRRHTREEKLLDAMATIISLQSGRQPVSLIRAPQSTNLELVIASAQPMTPSQLSNFELYLTLLTKTATVTDDLIDASEAELVVHAYRICRDEVNKIVIARAAQLAPTLPQIADAIKAYDAKKGEDVSYEIHILELARSAIKSLLAYHAAATADSAGEALVLQLHRDLVAIIPALYMKAEVTIMDSAVGKYWTRSLFGRNTHT